MNPKSLAVISTHVTKVHFKKILVEKVVLDKKKKKGQQIKSDLDIR